MNLIWWL